VSEVTEELALALARCVGAGGVAVFPSDTVYGLCCDPQDPDAAARLYALKGRPPERPAAVMFFDRGEMFDALGDRPAAERDALGALLPGPATVLIENPGRLYGPACGPDPGTLGLRVPLLEGDLAALRSVGVPVMQSSANLSGGADARVIEQVPAEILRGADLVMDAGELTGTPSTVIDLRSYAREGTWRVLREGALASTEVTRRLRAG
jgi:L-threonylcarbamoyladenylate synthase